MFAVVKIAGQQFKIKAGQNLYVPHLEGKSGDKIDIAEILLVEKDGKVNIGNEAKATVKAPSFSRNKPATSTNDLGI